MLDVPLPDCCLYIVLKEHALLQIRQIGSRCQEITDDRIVMLCGDQMIDCLSEFSGRIAGYCQRHLVYDTAEKLRNNRSRVPIGRGVLYSKMAAGIFRASLRTLKIIRVIECSEVDFMPLMQLPQGSKGSNLGAAIRRMQKKWADPENLHLAGLTPRVRD